MPRIFTSVFAVLFLFVSTAAHAQRTATGVVYHDANKNEKFDSGERALPRIRVSNGRDIVLTDEQGRYNLPVDDDTILFVIKPKGWRTPLSSDMLPRFYYIHKPSGSPASKYPGVAPTGALPASIDFPLYPSTEPEKFKAIMFGDPQPRNMAEVHYIYHDVIEQLVGTDASFGVTLGDIAFDNLETLEPLNRGIALLGIPWYNVIGNHDLNTESTRDEDSDETFHRIYGPSYYSFDYGNVHFLALDDVDWKGTTTTQRRSKYSAGLHPKQMEFIRNDLALIPPEQMVVLMMHIPLVDVENRRELYRLIEQRPLCMSISGHTHFQEHRFITREDGWRGAEPHHHIVNVTVSGSWWSGTPDELGIPHTTMRDGAPNGYAIMTFDGKRYDWEFVPARRPANHQMAIHAPEVWPLNGGTTEVLVNVFGGSEKSLVQMRVADRSEWTTMTRVLREDPYYAELTLRESGTSPSLGRKLPEAIKSPHLWSAMLPAGLPEGTHKINVRTVDMFGRTYEDERLIRIAPKAVLAQEKRSAKKGATRTPQRKPAESNVPTTSTRSSDKALNT